MLNEQLTHIHSLINGRDVDAIRTAIINLPEPEIAEILFELDTADRIILFRLLPNDIANTVFANLKPPQQNVILSELTQEETRQLLASLHPDDRTHLFEELPGRITQKLLNMLSADDLAEARQLLGYPSESVGRLMTPDYVAVRPEWTIQQVIQHVRRKGHDNETVNVLYVTDASWKLLDALALRRFILANPEDTVTSIMDYSFVSL